MGGLPLYRVYTHKTVPHQASIIRSIALRLIRPNAHMNVYIDFFSRACGALFFFSRRACGAQIPFQSIHIGHYKMNCGGAPAPHPSRDGSPYRKSRPSLLHQTPAPHPFNERSPYRKSRPVLQRQLLRRVHLSSSLPMGRAALYCTCQLMLRILSFLSPGLSP